MQKNNLKRYRADVEVKTPYIFEVQAVSELEARTLFQLGQCAYIGKGPDNREIGKIEEVTE